jgi:hypothetical protein
MQKNREEMNKLAWIRTRRPSALTVFARQRELF